MTTQQTIDDANNKLVAAQTAYNNAVTDQESKRARMQDWYNLVVQCNVNDRGVGNTIDRNSCGHKNSGPCQSISTCKSNVDTYNGAATDWSTAVATTASKKTLLDAAVAYKNQVIANAQNDPTFIAQQQQNANAAALAQKQLEDQKAKNRNTAIAIVLIVIVITGAILLWKKLK